MKKRNLLLPTAVAVAMVSVLAGVSANASPSVTVIAAKHAVEVFKGTAPLTSVSLTAASVLTSVNVPAGSSVTVVLQLSNGATWDTSVASSVFSSPATAASGGGSAGTFTVTYANSGGATLINSSSSVASNADVVLLSEAISGTAVAIGGSLIGSSTSNKIHAPALATAGAVTITATTYAGALTVLPASGSSALDSTSVPVNLVTSLTGITLAGSATAAGSQKVDLTSTPVGTQFISTGGTRSNVAILGSITPTTNSGSAKNGTSSAYVIGSKYFSINLTAPAGVFAAMNSTKKAWLEAGGCTAGAGSAFGTSAVGFASAAAAAAATSLTITTSSDATSATAYDICMEVDGVTAITPGTITAATTFGAAAAQDQAQTLAAFPLMILNFNGSQRDLRSYIPAGTTGYTSFVRTINTGSVSAAVSGQWLYENGTTSTPAILVSSLVGGGSVTLSSTQVEALIGTPSVIGSNRPRLRLTAPTNGLDAQAFFLTNATGNFSDVTGAQ